VVKALPRVPDGSSLAFDAKVCCFLSIDLSHMLIPLANVANEPRGGATQRRVGS
jgi:hypothetical protein